jgi:hypothetical protein
LIADAAIARKHAQPAEFAKFIAEQSPIWAELVKLSGAAIEN